MTDFYEIEDDPDNCRAIVLSMRLYIGTCAELGRLPSMSHMVEIAYGLDGSTKALMEAQKIGADNE